MVTVPLKAPWLAACVYVLAAVALTWPLLPRAATDVPGDLLDPLFSCWAMGWNLHAWGLASRDIAVASYWDANIFHPTPAALARSEHFFPQSVLAAPVFLLSRNLILAYNLSVLATFVLSAFFMYRFALRETRDADAALVAGFLYGFALFRWTQIEHLGGLSSQWMPLALLLAGTVAANADRPGALLRILALGAVTAIQLTSSGYYLLFFPPFLAAWGIIEGLRARQPRAWLHLAAAALVAAVLTTPLVLPYLFLRKTGAARDLASVVEHSADVLSWVTAPEITRLWGAILTTFPRGEARLFPGLVLPFLALAGVVAAVRAERRSLGAGAAGPLAGRRAFVWGASALMAVGLVGLAVALAGGRTLELGPVTLRAMSRMRPLLLIVAGVVLLGIASPGARQVARRLAVRREIIACALAVAAAWLALGPLVTFGGNPVAFPAPYGWLFAHVPGFSSIRAPARFAMIAVCFGSLAAAWGAHHVRRLAIGRPALLCLLGIFLLETAAVPLPLSRQWRDATVAPPPWRHGPSPIASHIRQLPADAVVASLPFGEIFYDVRAMFDSTAHWRRLLNGYSSWYPDGYVGLVHDLRDPLMRAPAVLAALRAAGATHVVVNEAAWTGRRGGRVTERLAAAGATVLACADDACLLAVGSGAVVP